MKTLLPFILLVLAHHFLLTPLIRKKLPLYIGLLSLLLVLFGVWTLSPAGRPGVPPSQRWRTEQAPPPFIRDREPRPEPNRDPLPGHRNQPKGKGQRRMKELQAENLSQRLESLRYQINPHFFMNTLNNIHALVDIDPEKAKESIEEFSKMMRILLYEGDSPTIPLAKELDFIEHFISLMRLRYPEDSVHIETIFPEDRSGVSVPPLVMASFVENAFKHGVSYSDDSFIRIKVEKQENKVVFLCSNSIHPVEGDERHGLGLENIRKRMALLYGNSYTLSIDENSGRYDVLMAIPSQPEIQLS